MLGYIGVTLALRPEPKERMLQPAPQHQDGKAMAALESQAAACSPGTVLQLDVAMEAPVIVMPRNSESKDKVQGIRWQEAAADHQSCGTVFHTSALAPICAAHPAAARLLNL